MICSMWLQPFVKTAHLILRVSSWTDILNLIRQEGVAFANLPWSRLHLQEEELQIAYLELLGLVLALLQVFELCSKVTKMAKRFCRKTITFKCDNSNVVSWFNKGRCPFYPWNRLLEMVFHLEQIL